MTSKPSRPQSYVYRAVRATPLTVNTPVARPAPSRHVLTRRLFILGGFWSGLMLAVIGLLGAPLDFLWARKIRGFGGPSSVTPDRVPAEGSDPVRIIEGKFWLVNLKPGTTPNGEESPGGLIALYQKCPHLGCTVPWNAGFDFRGRKGWFRCPCHNSTYTKEGGVLIFGPAPRSLDVFPLEVQRDRSIVVQTGRQFEGTGSPNNPRRTAAYEPGSATPPRGA